VKTPNISRGRGKIRTEVREQKLQLATNRNLI
jgi:hypothetical protein